MQLENIFLEVNAAFLPWHQETTYAKSYGFEKISSHSGIYHYELYHEKMSAYELY